MVGLTAIGVEANQTTQGHFNNAFLIMDAFAAAGYVAVGPDYFRGDPVWKHRGTHGAPSENPDFDFDAWKDKHWAFCETFVPEWVKEVKSKYGKADTKFACTGYWYVFPLTVFYIAWSEKLTNSHRFAAGELRSSANSCPAKVSAQRALSHIPLS